VHDRHIVDVTSGSFEKETDRFKPDSHRYDNDPRYAAMNVADLDTDLLFLSAYREKEEDIPPTMNNCVCYDFKERRIVTTHYTIRTNGFMAHLKGWLVETSADWESWQEICREEDSEQSHGW
jgi:hypothetical protein